MSDNREMLLQGEASTFPAAVYIIVAYIMLCCVLDVLLVCLCCTRNQSVWINDESPIIL